MNVNISNYPKSTLRIALAQVCSEDGNISKNVQTVICAIEKAAREKAKIVIFPEKFLTGYVPELINTDFEKYTICRNDIRIQPIKDACKRNNIYAIVGTPFRENDEKYISSIVINNLGEEIDVYSKTHLFYTETSIFKSNNNLSILNIDDWKIGLGICYDAGFAEHSRILAQAGCHLYLVSSLFSRGNGYSESRIWFPARALDNTIYAAMCNHVGTTGIWNACGSSAVWGPLGKVVDEASADDEELLVVDLDPAKLKEAREGELMLSDSFNASYTLNDIKNV
ncbi:MAG: carbon-nitrogen hydrolase family protein [Clostridium sp.]|nr:carbon-nitrogen hydrolase family protein [Clostridium sp.]